MTDLEKIEIYEEFNKQIAAKEAEINEREKSFKSYLATLKADFSESQKKLEKNVKETVEQKLDFIYENKIAINLSDLVEELAQVTKIKPEVNLIIELPVNDFGKYSEENIEETFEQFDKLDCNITIKLDNYRNYFDYRYLTFGPYSYVHLIKREEIHKDDCLLKIYNLDRLSGKSIQINYDLDKILIHVPLNDFVKNDFMKKVVINCLKKQEMNNKPKQLAKSI